MANFKQLGIISLTLSALLLSALSPCVEAGAAPISVAPLAPAQSTSTDDSQTFSLQKVKAHISRAAICTEDLSQISFSEYSVDWTTWMNDVAGRWTSVFNRAYTNGKFRPDGPAFVQFTCNNDGTIKEVSILSGSGDAMCDQKQIEALAECLPLPQFPVATKKDCVTLLYVWDYGVDKRSIAKHHAKPTHTPIVNQERISITGRTM